MLSACLRPQAVEERVPAPNGGTEPGHEAGHPDQEHDDPDTEQTSAHVQ